MGFEKGNNIGNRFDSENQPANRGRKGKTTTEYLRELGEAKAIEFEITVTKSNGDQQKKKGKVESKTDLNELLANLLFADAINGNHKARKEILDRTEGRPKQTIDLNDEREPISEITVTRIDRKKR